MTIPENMVLYYSMYKHISLGIKVVFIVIGIIAFSFIICGKCAFAEDPATEEKAPAAEEKAATPTEETSSPDVTPVDLSDDDSIITDKEAVGIQSNLISGTKEPFLTKAVKEPVLKKTDINRIGASTYYETYEGLRLLKYFTVAQRVEIYQEPRPVDAYILDAFSMSKLYGTPWNRDDNYRTHIVPIFTRAYGTEFTMSDPKNKEGQIRYTHDYREIYRNYYPKYPAIKLEQWDQNEVLVMHSKQIEPLGWNYTSNFGYRYSTMNAKNDPSYREIRQTYFSALSIAPSDKLEWFGEGEYYKSKHLKYPSRPFYYNPDHFMGRIELRMRTKDMKTSLTPSIRYSKDLYYPFANTYEKYEIQYRIGRDFTKRFSGATTLKYTMGLRDEPDNTAPTYIGKNPFKDKAYTTSWENRISYNVYDRLHVQLGFDLSNGLNMSAFDNWGILAGLEYYAPGMIRVDVGWRGNHYYNIDDYLSSVYFKFYLFM